MVPHYFFAVVIPDKIKRLLHEEMQQQPALFKRYTHPDDYHITLAFIGAAEEKPLQSACRLAEQFLKGALAFELQFTSFDVFGPKASPRIFWMGTSEPASLFALHEKIAAACRKAGLTIDEKPFRPHVTAARKWAGAKPYESLPGRQWPFFQVEEVALYQSNPLASPKYTKVWSYLLQANEEQQNGSID